MTNCWQTDGSLMADRHNPMAYQCELTQSYDGPMADCPKVIAQYGPLIVIKVALGG